MGFWSRFRKPKVKASYSASSTGGGQPAFPSDNYRSQITEAWKNVWAFRCIDFIAQSCASVEWRFEEKTKDNIRVLEEPNLIRLLKRPNREESWSTFIYKVQAYKKCNGNSYILRTKTLTRKDNSIMTLTTLMPDKVEPIVKDGKLIKYIYKDNVKNPEYPVDPITGECDILHLKEFNPLDEIFGKARTQVASYEIDTSNQATKWNFKLLYNEAKLGLMLLFKQFLNDEQLELVERKVREKHEGSDNAGKTLILGAEGGIDARPYTLTPQEMDFIEGSRENARKIAVAYGLPSMLLGIPGDNTYSNYAAARLAFWEETVTSELNYLKEEISSWMFPDSNYRLACITDNVPAFKEKRMVEWEKIDKLTSLTLNEKRKLMGFEPKDGGDTIFISGQLIPLDGVTENIPEKITKAKLHLINMHYEEDLVNELIGAMEW